MKNITTEFKNNGVFRYYIKTLGFKTVPQEDRNLMYFTDSLGHQIVLKYSPEGNTISFLNKNGFTIFKGETCTKEDVKNFIKV
jgi:hypothetical protein